MFIKRNSQTPYNDHVSLSSHHHTITPSQVASHVIDRVSDISRFFPVAIDVGCGRGHIAKQMSTDLISTLYQCDMADRAVVRERERERETVFVIMHLIGCFKLSSSAKMQYCHTSFVIALFPCFVEWLLM